MLVPDSRHFDQVWVVHSLTEGFRLEDVWQFPIEAGPQQDLSLFQTCSARVLAKLETRGLSGMLFRLRFLLGKLFGWDHKTSVKTGLRPHSLRARYASFQSAQLPDPETGDRMPFEWVYRLPTEYLSEIENSTCHAALHLGWVPLGGERFTVQMAVYVKPKGWLGRCYMALIRPFRLWIVYPTMMRLAQKEWRLMTAT